MKFFHAHTFTTQIPKVEYVPQPLIVVNIPDIDLMKRKHNEEKMYLAEFTHESPDVIMKHLKEWIVEGKWLPLRKKDGLYLLDNCNQSLIPYSFRTRLRTISTIVEGKKEPESRYLIEPRKVIFPAELHVDDRPGKENTHFFYIEFYEETQRYKSGYVLSTNLRLHEYSFAFWQNME